MSSAVASASLGSAHVLPCKCVAARSGGHHDELRSGEKMDERRSFRRPTTRAKLAKIRMLLSGSPKMGPTRCLTATLEKAAEGPHLIARVKDNRAVTVRRTGPQKSRSSACELDMAPDLPNNSFDAPPLGLLQNFTH